MTDVNSCGVTEADQFFQFQQRIVQRGSFAARAAFEATLSQAAHHSSAQKSGFHWVLVGPNAIQVFENAEICTHGIQQL